MVSIAPAHSGVATAHSGAQSDASHRNDYVVDSAASPLPARSQFSSEALADGLQPAGSVMQTVVSLTRSGQRGGFEPEYSGTAPAGSKRKALHDPASPRSVSPLARANSLQSAQHVAQPSSPLHKVVASASDSLPPQHPDFVMPASLPHCVLPSARRATSAANSVEAVQQDGDDEVVGCKRPFGGVIAPQPATSSARHQQPATSQHSFPAPTTSHKAASQPPAATLEHGRSVVFDSESRRETQLSTRQQPDSLPLPAGPAQNKGKTSSPSGQQTSPAQSVQLSPECSAASEGQPDASRPVQNRPAALEVTQQAIIQEASSNQRYDEEASQHMLGSGDTQAQSTPLPTATSSPAQLLHLSLLPVQPEVAATVMQPVPTAPSLSAVSGTSQQHQTSASNDGQNVREDSAEQQHAAASVNARGTVVEEELPVSDAETDLSSVGLRHSAQGSVEYFVHHTSLR